jgi:hypothetical protein
MTSLKTEASVDGGIKGFQAPLGDNEVVRKMLDVSEPFNEKIGDPISDPDLFECLVAAAEVAGKKIKETVRKRGNKYVLYDDDTDVAKGAYDDRDTAWEKQRVIRRSEKNKEKHKASEKERKRHEVPAVDKPRKPTTPKMTPGPKKLPKPETDKPKERQKVRALDAFFKDMFGHMIKEGSMVSYVFENTPLSDESVTWDSFINKLSKQTVMADPKLNKILHYIAKVELGSLKKAANTVKETLDSTKHFQVEIGKKIERDEATQTPKLDFVVAMKDNNKKLKFSIRLDNGKPLFMWEQSKDALDQMANEESKLLRAELVHIQETTFKQMSDIVSAIEKRDRYLKSLEQKFDKVLSNINPLEMNMLKYLLRDKYKSVR